ncbi:zf-CCHC domain-containing protein [Tanacetum coccineum]|uniref:Zf-CCHC domain-containing protein n=1 Tax=Tanacetum coccineum TaxID=301880 RepID=A0ABQ5BBQ2_9ASTR
MTLYNALPHKLYKRVFMCKIIDEVWHTPTITQQGNLQVKDCKIDLLTQQYEEFSNSSEETIDSGFTRFNDIVTSLKSLDQDYSSKNYVRKFLRALLLKWRAKVTAIEEAKDLAALFLDELIGNLKVYEMNLVSDGFASKPIKEKVMPIGLKANVTKGQTSSNSIGHDKSGEDEEINLMAKNFRKLFQKGVKKHDKFNICKEKTKGGESSRRECGCYNCGNKNQFIGDCPKPRRNKAFVEGAWSDCEDRNEPQNDATCLMAIDSQEVWHERNFQTDHRIMDSGFTNHTSVNRRLFNSYSLNQDKYIIPKSRVFKLGNILPTSKHKFCLASIVDNSTLWHKRLGHANMQLIQNIADAYNRLN